MQDKFKVVFNGGRGKAKCAPNPKYPNGMTVDLAGNRKGCIVSLPYPAPEVGIWVVECKECSLTIALTAAGRIDDPKAVIVPCKTKESTRNGE